MVRSARRLVLVADDAPEVAHRLADALHEELEVDILGPAVDGRQAIELFRVARPDAVVLDFAMPQLDGLAVLERIRASGFDGPVIIFTNHREASIDERCLAAGADRVLHKQSELEALIELLRTRLAS